MYKYQSGFQVSDLTDICLYYLNNKVLRGFNNGLSTSIILTGLQKAFITINHDILFKQLLVIGFSPHTTDCLKFYLSNINFLVKTKNSNSSLLNNLSEIPRSSILGPSIFLIYVNLMVNVVQSPPEWWRNWNSVK